MWVLFRFVCDQLEDLRLIIEEVIEHPPTHVECFAGQQRSGRSTQAASTKLLQPDQVILVSAACLVSSLKLETAAVGFANITATAPHRDRGPGVGDRARAERPFGSLQAY
ncbi:hypothetical protein ABBQ32_002875 [Trebouxia sp. C0010 RCD-2024]